MHSTTHEIYETWNTYLLREDKKQQIQLLLDAQGLLLFFIHEDMVFGTTEPNRVTFSQLKKPDDESTPGWRKQANFMAFNLTKCLANGSPEQKIFYNKDLAHIHVISKEEAFDILSSEVDKIDIDSILQSNKGIARITYRPELGKNDEP